MDLKLTPEQAATRDKFQAFIDDAFPVENREHPSAATISRWHQRVVAEGLSVPDWPQAFGGRDWNGFTRYTWQQLIAENCCPGGDTIGLTLAGPLMIATGNPELETWLRGIRQRQATWGHNLLTAEPDRVFCPLGEPDHALLVEGEQVSVAYGLNCTQQTTNIWLLKHCDKKLISCDATSLIKETLASRRDVTGIPSIRRCLVQMEGLTDDTRLLESIAALQIRTTALEITALRALQKNDPVTHLIAESRRLAWRCSDLQRDILGYYSLPEKLPGLNEPSTSARVEEDIPEHLLMDVAVNTLLG